MPNDPLALKNSQTRVFTLEGGSGPGAVAQYQGRARALAPDHAGGDFTPIRAPSRNRYGDFDIIAKIRAQPGLPTLGLELNSTRSRSVMHTLFLKRCDVDVQVHMGECQDPTDFLSYDAILVLEAAQPTNWGATELGTFEEEALVRETLPFSGENMYYIVPVRETPTAATAIQQEVVGVAVIDGVSCGQCGAPSDGASVIFAVTVSEGGSPGLPGEVIFTQDAGSTVGSTIVTTLGANEDASDLAGVGTNVVVISAEDNALHYAPVQDILLEQEAWTRVATGFVALKLPNRIFSLGRTFTWIAADDGYIYFSSDITAGVTPQTDGSVTVEDLVDIHGVDELNLIAVGDSNAVLVTTNGGNVWSSVTGPAPAVNLTACVMRSAREWIVGDAGGNLWYTRDGGLSWTAKAFTGSGSGTINALAFATRSVGFMAHTLNGKGWVLRTVDGGASWTRVPDGGNISSFTDNDRINRLAVAPSAPDDIRANVVWAAGLGADAADGILLKIAA